MAKTKEQKQDTLKMLTEKISLAKSVVFTNFSGLLVKDNEDLRKRLRQEDSEYYVAKKTLLDLAFRDAKINDLDIKNFDGRVAVVFGYGEEVAPAKIVGQFKQEHAEKINFIGGILEGKFLNAQEVATLSKLPGKQELYAQLVGSLLAPISGFANVLAGNLRSLVYVLSAIKEEKE